MYQFIGSMLLRVMLVFEQLGEESFYLKIAKFLLLSGEVDRSPCGVIIIQQKGPQSEKTARLLVFLDP